MVAVTKQLCIKSFEITAENGDYFKVEQGRTYTTTAPDDDDEVVVFSRYWVHVPKQNFVPIERNQSTGGEC